MTSHPHATRPEGLQLQSLPGGWLVGQARLLANLPGLRHAVTTRLGPGGASLDGRTSQGRGNQRLLCDAIGARAIATVRQVHGNEICEASRALRSEIEADGLMTDQQDVALLGVSADCPIVLVADGQTGAVGMAHASWRGTVAGITSRLIDAMQNRYDCRPADMLAVICPSAGPCCYEVGEEVRAAAIEALGLEAEGFFARSGDQLVFDLWAANTAQLVRAGLCRYNVAHAGVCTICDKRFFSYRREGDAAGRFGGLILRS